jgi:hypothetical protein
VKADEGDIILAHVLTAEAAGCLESLASHPRNCAGFSLQKKFHRAGVNRAPHRLAKRIEGYSVLFSHVRKRPRLHALGESHAPSSPPKMSAEHWG